jgi:ATP-dependent Lon protease
MTGEIDTQGRILPVGGLDVKLETAIDAGCKTLIIPKSNLHGEGGIERLPEALKKELQILTYEEWVEERPGFDYERHMLQVIAVDHITQAADIAFIDAEELDALPALFRPQALSTAGVLAERRHSPGVCACLFHAKEPEELDIEAFKEPFWEQCRSMFLAQPEVKKEIQKRYPDIEKKVPILDLEDYQDGLFSMIDDVRNTLCRETGAPARLSLVAPYYFLLRSGLADPKNPVCTGLEEIRLFANNYTTQGFKIKECKPLLNRVLCHIALMPKDQLDNCPFLEKVNGVYTIDLSFIPEKYRLDPKRAKYLVSSCLEQWLATLEESLRKDTELQDALAC